MSSSQCARQNLIDFDRVYVFLWITPVDVWNVMAQNWLLTDYQLIIYEYSDMTYHVAIYDSCANLRRRHSEVMLCSMMSYTYLRSYLCGNLTGRLCYCSWNIVFVAIAGTIGSLFIGTEACASVVIKCITTEACDACIWHHLSVLQKHFILYSMKLKQMRVASLKACQAKPGGCFTNVSRALQNNLAKIYNVRNNIYAENFKLQICTCAQSMSLGTRTHVQVEIIIRITISAIHKFRENILKSSRNVSETPPWVHLVDTTRMCSVSVNTELSVPALCMLSKKYAKHFYLCDKVYIILNFKIWT